MLILNHVCLQIHKQIWIGKSNMAKSVYIHIPFCRSICSYCDFCKMYYDEKVADKYLDALFLECKDNYNGEKLNTLYIGGGTPSTLSNTNFEKLFKNC